MMHLDDTTLARLRGDEERDEDAEAFRHLASCAVCRARLVEDPADVGKIVPAEAPKTAKVVQLSERRVGGRALVLASGVFVAAAVFVIMFLALNRPHEAPAIALRTKSFTGTMGSTSAAAVSPSDMNYELSFDAPQGSGATLVVIDAKGRGLAPLKPFEREGGALKVVVAPRTFAKHEGEARAIVVSGTADAVTAANKELEAAFAQGPLAKEEIAAIAQRHMLASAATTLP